MSVPSRYEPSKALSGIDKILLRGAASHKSPNELSALTNGVVAPAAAAQRVIDLLDARDWLTEQQAEKLILDDLMVLKDKLMGMVEGGAVDKAAAPLNSTLKTIAALVASRKTDLSALMTQVSRAQAQMMLAAISIGLERSNMIIESRYPDIPRGQLAEVFTEIFPDVVLEVESRVAEE